ncbi:MAG: hypothetical protein IPP88_20805 [Betaproteobacteria bacterium]|nr:hypothetical protein [Betaproteobacteria bacterium]
MVLNVKGAAIGLDGYGKVDDAHIQDTVIWNAASGLFMNNGDHALTVNRMTIGKLSKPAFALYAGRESTLDVQNSIIANVDRAFSGEMGRGKLTHQYNNCHANNHRSCYATGETSFNPLTGGLKHLPRIEMASALKKAGDAGHQVGAQIVNRIGGNGSMFGDSGFNAETTENLWPWPYEDRLRSDLCADGVVRGFCAKSLSLTDYVWNYLTPNAQIVRPYAISEHSRDNKKN